LPLAALATALFGFLLGLPALRLEGPYLSIATLGFGLTITQVIGRLEFFGGRQGLHTPELVIGPWHLNSDKDFYYLLIFITILLTLATRNLIKTKVGRAFIAIRDADIAAETMGVNLMVYKTLAFAISAFYTGLAGGLYAFVLRFIEPQNIQSVDVYYIFGHGGGWGSWLHIRFHCRSLLAFLDGSGTSEHSQYPLPGRMAGGTF
ncbi:MAG: branched-chain amino acid ABC transporter permease, partial [Desulfatiglandales bacterium]|nr:branched-chain amino acid ABC transporter permease [Desulfatiglandales bacterium]